MKFSPTFSFKNLFFIFRLNLIFTIVFFFTVKGLHSHTCKTFSQYDEYDFSDAIFLAEIINDDKSIFSVKIIEVFKGNISKNDTLPVIFFDNFNKKNDLINFKKEIWLIYSSLTIGDSLKVNDCGWSRSFNRPLKIPPPPRSDGSPIDYSLINHYETRALSALHFDILHLRSLKEKKQILKIEKQHAQLKRKLSFHLYFSIGICVLLVLILIKLLKTNKSD